jgi:hypothetical protein
VLALLRHTLIAFGEQPPQTTPEVFARVAGLTGSKPTAFDAVWRLRNTRNSESDLTNVYDSYLAAIEGVVEALDRHVPKKHWQRTGS